MRDNASRTFFSLVAKPDSSYARPAAAAAQGSAAALDELGNACASECTDGGVDRKAARAAGQLRVVVHGITLAGAALG
jgi:hypothetical protein